jgi:hypothetical protein
MRVCGVSARRSLGRQGVRGLNLGAFDVEHPCGFAAMAVGRCEKVPQSRPRAVWSEPSADAGLRRFGGGRRFFQVRRSICMRVRLVATTVATTSRVGCYHVHRSVDAERGPLNADPASGRLARPRRRSAHAGRTAPDGVGSAVDVCEEKGRSKFTAALSAGSSTSSRTTTCAPFHATRVPARLARGPRTRAP